LSRQLTTIVADIKEAPDLSQIGWQGIHTDGFELFCDEMGFGNTFNERARQLKSRQAAVIW
jgi:hypothetical protein